MTAATGVLNTLAYVLVWRLLGDFACNVHSRESRQYKENDHLHTLQIHRAIAPAENMLSDHDGWCLRFRLGWCAPWEECNLFLVTNMIINLPSMLCNEHINCNDQLYLIFS